MQPSIRLALKARPAIDTVLGEWAYPVFLVQWLVGFLIAVMLPQDLWRGWTLMLLSAVPITFLAAALAALNSKFADTLRTKARDVHLQTLVVSDKIVHAPVQHVSGGSQFRTGAARCLRVKRLPLHLQFG